MIQIEPFPLNPVDEKAIRAWLTKTESQAFIRLLRHQAAKLSAEAGNLMTEYHGPNGGDHHKEDAEDKAVAASRYIQLAQLMMTLSDQATPFETINLSPKPSTTNE